MTTETSLPASWVECRLGDVVPYGSTQKAEPTEIPPDAWVLELEDIEKGTSKILQRLTFAQRQSKSTKNRFSAGDVLYGKLRPYLNKVVRADEDGYCTTEIIPLKLPEAVVGGYLFYWLKTPAFLEYVTSVSHGLNMPQLGTEAGKNAPFVLAPTNEQKHIADKLDGVLARVDACRERLHRVPDILKRFRQGVLAAATSGKLTEEWRQSSGALGSARVIIRHIAEERKRLGLSSLSRKISEEGMETPTSELPDCWAWCRVGEIADVRLGGMPSRREPTYWKGDIPWVSSGEVRNGRISDTAEKITRAGLENSNAKIYPKGTVLIAMIGEGKTRGQSAILEVDAATNQNSAGLVFDVPLVEPTYIWFWALAEYERTRALGRGGSQPALNGAKVRALPMSLPPREEQIEIVRRVECLFSYADHLEARYAAALSQVERLTPALFDKAFRGELVPQDPSDEPASVLLERIHAARAATPAKPRRRQAATRSKKAKKPEVPMLSRNDVQDTHLTKILKERGPLTAESLWSASQLDIDDFYDQLKDEETRGLLRENRGQSPNASRTLEAIA